MESPVLSVVTEFVAQQPYIVLGLAALALIGIACTLGRSADDIPAASTSVSCGSVRWECDTQQRPCCHARQVVAVAPASSKAKSRKQSSKATAAAPAPTPAPAPAPVAKPAAAPSPTKTKAKQHKAPAAAVAAALPEADAYEPDEIWDPAAGSLHVEVAAQIKADSHAAAAARVAASAAPSSSKTAASAAPTSSSIHAAPEHEAAPEDFGGNWKAAPSRRRKTAAA